jgi:hypothetical protein
MAGPLIPFSPPAPGPWSGGYSGFRGAGSPLAPTTPAQANAEGMVGLPGATKEVTTHSDTTALEKPVIGKAEMAAAAKVEKSQNDIKEASVKKMDAENELENKALAAEARRVEQENAAAERAQQLEADIIAKNEQAQAAADKAQRDADERVRTSQDQAINWDDRGAGTRILQALIRGSSAKNQMIMGNAGGESHVIKAMDENLAAEKEKKMRRYMADVDFAKTLKTQNKEEIDRMVGNMRAKATLEANANARALLMSEKTDALAAKIGAKDPNGQAYQANKALALSLLDKSDAEANRAYAATTRGRSTTGGTTQTVTTEGAAADKRPEASREDVDSKATADADIKALEELKTKIAANPGALEHVTKMEQAFKRGKELAKTREKVPFGVGALSNMAAGLIPFPGRPEDKAVFSESPAQMFDSEDFPEAGSIYQGKIQSQAAVARTLGGVVRDGDLEYAAKLEQAGNVTGDPKAYAAYLDNLIKLRKQQRDGLVNVRKGL